MMFARGRVGSKGFNPAKGRVSRARPFPLPARSSSRSAR